MRYESAYSNGTWGVGTATGSYGPTGGHALFFPQYGGDPNYPNVPGDHFGVALNATPTNTIYRWLLDGGNGTLVQAGTAVKVPTPVLTVAPPANPVNQAAVQAVVQAPRAENGQQFGDAIWAKVFTTVVENAGPVHLNDLVQGNPAVPPETETEVEWQLLQSNKAGFAERLDQGDVANGNESVTRRYEFYAYAGQYDLETTRPSATPTHPTWSVPSWAIRTSRPTSRRSKRFPSRARSSWGCWARSAWGSSHTDAGGRFDPRVISPLVTPVDAPMYLATATPEPSSVTVAFGVATIVGVIGMARRLLREEPSARLPPRFATHWLRRPRFARAAHRHAHTEKKIMSTPGLDKRVVRGGRIPPAMAVGLGRRPPGGRGVPADPPGAAPGSPGR